MTETLNTIAAKWFAVEFAMLWQVTVLIAVVATVDLLIRRWAWLPVFIFLPIAFIELDSMKT